MSYTVGHVAAGSAVFRTQTGQRIPVVVIDIDKQRMFLTLDAAESLMRILPAAKDRALQMLGELGDRNGN